MAVLDNVDKDYPEIETVRISRPQREYIKSRLPIMTLSEIAEHLGLHIVVLRKSLQRCGLFMQHQREYNPQIVWCVECDGASPQNKCRNGVCFHCRAEAQEMAKLDRPDGRGRPKKETQP